MEKTQKMRLFDQGLCKYITSKDPTRKSSSISVFMRKRELDTFYGQMYSKTNQQLKLSQIKYSSNHDGNKLLIKEQERFRKKIYSRTFYSKTHGLNSQNLSDKQNIKINPKPLISDNFFKGSKRIEAKNQCKFLTLANAELLMSEFLENNRQFRERKAQSMSHGNGMKKQNGNSKKICESSLNNSYQQINDPFEDEMPHRKAELIELYQNLYQQFTKQKMKTVHTKTRIQGKFPKGVIQEKPTIAKARQSVLKLTIAPNKKRSPIKL